MEIISASGSVELLTLTVNINRVYKEQPEVYSTMTAGAIEHYHRHPGGFSQRESS